MARDILIIGGSSGVGRELAVNLAASGDTVHLASRHEGEPPGASANYQYYDVTDPDATLDLR